MISSYFSLKPITSTNGWKKFSINTHGIQRGPWPSTWRNLQPLNWKIGTKVSTWPTNFPCKPSMSSKSSTPSTNFTSTLSKQQSKAQPCLLMERLLLWIHCKKRRNKFTFTTRFFSQSLTRLPSTTVRKRANKQLPHLLRLTQTSLTWKFSTTLEFQTWMSFTWF